MVLIVIIAAMSGDSSPGLEDKLKERPAKKYQPSTEKGSVVGVESVNNTSKDVMKNDPIKSDDEEDFDDDDDWSAKDPNYKGEKFEGREGFNK